MTTAKEEIETAMKAAGWTVDYLNPEPNEIPLTMYGSWKRRSVMVYFDTAERVLVATTRRPAAFNRSEPIIESLPPRNQRAAILAFVRGEETPA